MKGDTDIKIKQSLNQNALVVADRNKEEFLAIGKGIGFGKKKGDFVHLKSNVKKYPMNYSEQDQKFLDLINEIPDELVLVVEETIKGAEEILETKLNYTLIF